MVIIMNIIEYNTVLRLIFNSWLKMAKLELDKEISFEPSEPKEKFLLIG